MRESFENLRPICSRKRSSCPRGGMFVLELILLLPIILLVLVLLYQVSIMMTTYQALRVTVFDATTAFAQNPVQPEVEGAIHAAIQGYYFRDATVEQARNASEWATVPGNTATVKYRLLYSSDSGNTWNYYTAEMPPAGGTLIAVELKLENAEKAYGRYWLLSRFANVRTIQSGSMVLSQITTPKI